MILRMFPFFLLLFLRCSLPLHAALNEEWNAAKSAYDAGELDQAISAYESMITAGQSSLELYYNLGNSYYRTADFGQAMLNYRRAWHLAPSDPDLMANINFTQQKSGAVLPTPTWIQQAFGKLSTRQYILLMVAGLWLATLGLTASFFSQGNRAINLRRTAASGVALLMAALCGMFITLDIKKQNEVVVQQDETEALFAPIAGSTPHFSLPLGSVARLLEDNGDWMKIKSGKDIGWIRSASCEAVRLP